MMKKTALFLLTGLALTVSVSGCGKDKSAAENSSEMVTETTAAAEPITGYLIDGANSYVTLGDYKEIAIEKPVYEVTADEINMEAENYLYDYSTTQEVDRAAQIGDVLTVNFTAAIEGETKDSASEENYSVELGYEEFGPDFDSQLTGAKTGDTKTFSCSYDEDAWYDDWNGKTVNFEVTINKIEETIIPEYTEDFVKTELGYDSKADFEASLKETLTANHDEQSNSEASENAMLAAMDTCTFKDYPEDLYNSCEESVKESYSEFATSFGMSESEIYEAFGMTDEDLKTEILDTVNRRLFISALCEKENISLTTDDYGDYIQSQYSYYGYEDASTFATDYGKDYLIWQLYEARTKDFLLSNAQITEVAGNLNEEYTDEDAEGEMVEEEETLNALPEEDSEASTESASEEL
ncbi:MAG: FKBP-type peptidyl-prolyl cis-trans isomerase [Lachnospiraceae bacterium]|nr:FKBP-type peptidyl-prolyl cis-trans isomerase [Lachnospiraceae bacterium]